MKVFQIIILAAIVALFLGLAGCDKTDGQIELKEPRTEFEEMPSSKVWNVSDVFDDAEESTE
ncbi:MAG: hypothetical protein DHS20C05_13230 [Hyphococcus sp.]|nr:MAG: hypothetical protein DHS20C05_13230 [Marinicaulis sp.]